MKRILLLLMLISLNLTYGQVERRRVKIGGKSFGSGSPSDGQIMVYDSTSNKWVYDKQNVDTDTIKTKIISCVARNEGSGWYVLNNAAHIPIGIDSIENFGTFIRLHYNFTASKVSSVLITVDEYYAQKGIYFGASAGAQYCDIYAGRMGSAKSINDYIYYNGSGWSNYGDHLDSVKFSNGTLTIYHQSIVGYDVNVEPRDGNYIMGVGSINNTTTRIIIKDYNGNLVTTPTYSMKLFFSKTEKLKSWEGVNMSDIYSSGGNFWLYGIFEE